MAEPVTPTAPAPSALSAAGSIGGLSVLRGMILYAAVLAFAGLYIDFIVRISTTKSGVPALDAALVSAAAALAGVLGSAFALEIGTTTDAASTNRALRDALANARTPEEKALARVRQALSIDPRNPLAPSWPKTFGIWAYGIVGSAVAITYILNQNQTPGTIKALAVVFGGYVIALVTAAYKSGS